MADAAVRYSPGVAKPVILSQDTVSALLEANAALAAWYYQLTSALQRGGVAVEPPSLDQRLAHLKQVALELPEVAGVASEIAAPRPYMPTPVVAAPVVTKENEGVVVPPPPAVSEPHAVDAAAPPPPLIVDPTKVRYD